MRSWEILSYSSARTTRGDFGHEALARGVKRWNEKRAGKSAPEKRPGVTVNRRDLLAIPHPSADLLWRDLRVRNVQRVEGRQQTSNVRIDLIVEGVDEAGPAASNSTTQTKNRFTVDLFDWTTQSPLSACRSRVRRVRHTLPSFLRCRDSLQLRRGSIWVPSTCRRPNRRSASCKRARVAGSELCPSSVPNSPSLAGERSPWAIAGYGSRPFVERAGTAANPPHPCVHVRQSRLGNLAG